MITTLPGYDAWKTTPPDDDHPDERDPDCICGRRRHKWCPVHGADPDEAYERERDDR